MWKIEEHFKVIIGTNTFIDVPNILCYNGEPIFTLERNDDGLLGISFDVFEKTGKRVATIRENRIVQGDEQNYIFTREMYKYEVTDKSTGEVICSIRRGPEATGSELYVTVNLYMPDGFLAAFTPTGTNIKHFFLKDCTFKGVRIGFNLGKNGNTLAN